MAALNELQGSSGNECWGTYRHFRLGMIHTQVRFLPDISQKMCWDWGWMPMLGNAHLSVRAAGWRSEKAGRREGFQSLGRRNGDGYGDGDGDGMRCGI